MKLPSRACALVVGGGPAGCAVALGLARAGASSVVVERSAGRRFQIGETLRPSVGQVLTRLGLEDAFSTQRHLTSHAIASSWGSEALEVDNRLFDPAGPGWHLDRARFDAWLRREAAQAGALVIDDAKLRACARRAGGWDVVLTCADQERSMRVDVLVDATGASASVARRQGARRLVYDRMVGWSRVFDDDAPVQEGFLLVEATEDGWWYSVPLPTGGLLVVFVTGPDDRGAATTAGWTARLAGTIHTRDRVPGVGAAPPRPWAISSARLDRCVGPDWLAVGDAASVYDPLAAIGVEKALRTGADAAEAIVAGPAARADYLAGVERDFESYLSLRCAYYCAESRWPSAPFWRRRRQIDPTRATVRLSPHAMLGLSPGDPVALPPEVETILSPREWTRLRDVIASGAVAAHACAAALRPHADARHGDRRIVVALERMLDHGTLRCPSP